MSDAAVLEIEGLTIALPPGADRADAVTDLSLSLLEGKVTCLIGESGSGKSLVARSVLGLLPERVRVRAGSIRFQGRDLTKARAGAMRAIRGAGIAMIFQEPMTALNPLHTIGRQVGEVLRIHTRLGAAARRARVVELLDSVRLPEPGRLLHSHPHQLSGGQRQRAMIAMALALRPRLLIADEPTTALDVTTQAQILHLIRELQREHGTAVLFITHDFGVVADVADSVAVLRRGVLVEQGGVADVLRRPQHAYTQALIAAVPKLQPPPERAASQAPFIIQASGLVKTYGGRGLFGGRVVRALDGVEMTLRQGETLGLVGESGSGKSTLARAVTRLMPVDAGEILLAGRDIAPLRRGALLVVERGARGPHPGRDHQEARAADATGQGRLVRAGDHAVAAAVHRLADAPLHQGGHRLGVADLPQVLAREAGQHRHRQYAAPVGPHPPAHRRAHDLRLGVDGEQVAGVLGGDGGRRLLDRGADVVQLPVEEHRAAAGGEVARHRHAVARQELQPDLVGAHRLAQRLDHGLRGGAVGQVQRDDQAGVGGHGRRVPEVAGDDRSPMLPRLDATAELGRAAWARRPSRSTSSWRCSP